MNELSLISTDDLIAELLNRHDHAIFMGLKNPRQDEVTTVRRWKGNSITCSGLCNSLSRSALNDFTDREEQITKDEF